MIADELQPHAIPIDSVTPLHRNARRGNVEAIAASLTRWGQVKPIVVSRDGQILAGNHTHAAAVRLGWDEIAAVTVDVDASDTEAIALAIADNRISDLSRWENDLLADLLQSVAAADETLLLDTGFTLEQVEELVTFVDGPTGRGSQPSDEGGEGDNSVGGATCPTCQRPL